MPEPVSGGGAPLVAILNVTAARQMWKMESPLGRRVRIRSSDGVAEFATVVGVVADMRHRGLTQPPVMEVFFPYAQRPFRTFGTALVVRALTKRFLDARRDFTRPARTSTSSGARSRLAVSTSAAAESSSCF